MVEMEGETESVHRTTGQAVISEAKRSWRIGMCRKNSQINHQQYKTKYEVSKREKGEMDGGLCE